MDILEIVSDIIKVWIFPVSTLNPYYYYGCLLCLSYTCLFVCSLSITSVLVKVVLLLLLLLVLLLLPVVVVVVLILRRKLPCCKRKHVNLLGCHSVDDWLFFGSLSRYGELELSTGLYEEKEGTYLHIHYGIRAFHAWKNNGLYHIDPNFCRTKLQTSLILLYCIYILYTCINKNILLSEGSSK